MKAAGLGAILVGGALLALSVAAFLSLSILKSGITVKTLPGIQPNELMFRVDARLAANSQRPTYRQLGDAVSNGIPEARLMAIRYVEASVEAQGRSFGPATIALLAGGDPTDFGVVLAAGAGYGTTGGNNSREVVVAGGLGSRLSTPSVIGSTVSLMPKGGGSTSTAQTFRIVGETTPAFRGFAHGRSVDLLVAEREWRNWLTSADLPDDIRDEIFPLETVLLKLPRSLQAQEVESLLVSGAEAAGTPMVVSTVAGMARDPVKIARASAQTTTYALMAAGATGTGAIACILCWRIALNSRRRSYSIRAMLGEPIARSRRRLGRDALVTVAIALIAGSLTAIGIVRAFALREPFSSVASGSLLVPLTQWGAQIAIAGLLVGAVMAVMLLAVERYLGQIHRTRLSAPEPRLGFSVLVGLVACCSVAAMAIGASSARSLSKLQVRDLGFSTAGLLEIQLIKSPQQLSEAFLDPSPSREVVARLRERLSSLPGVSGVAASSNHLLRRTLTHEFQLYEDRSQQRRLGNLARVSEGFFNVLRLRGDPIQFDDVLNLAASNEVLVDEAFVSNFPESGTAFELFTLENSGGSPRVEIVETVPSMFHSGAAGDPVATIYQPMQRLADLNWLWVRIDRASLFTEVTYIADEVLREYGVRFDRLQARHFEETLRAQLIDRIAERDASVLSASTLTLLGALGALALYAYLIGSRAREHALHVALGAGPLRAFARISLRGWPWQAAGLAAGAGSALLVLMPMGNLLGLESLEIVEITLVACIATCAMIVLSMFAVVALRRKNTVASSLGVA